MLEAMNPLVLAVDDERDILDLVCFHLTRAGCDVITAASGRDALETNSAIDADALA